MCPSCDSRYLQPMRCEVQEDESVQVELRCSDCMTVLQVLSLFLMEPPTSFHPEAIRDEKVKLLRAIQPLDDEALGGDDLLLPGEHARPQPSSNACR